MKSRMYEHSMQLLKRLDDQYDKVNTKISLYIAVNTTFTAAAGVMFKEFEIQNNIIVYSLIITAFLSITSIILLIYAASPYLPKKKSKEKGDLPNCQISRKAIQIITESDTESSLIYFKDIASQDNSFFNRYCELFNFGSTKKNTNCGNQFLDKVIPDILAQIYLLSQGLNKRNSCLKIVSIIMSIALGIIGFMLLFIIIKVDL